MLTADEDAAVGQFDLESTHVGCFLEVVDGRLKCAGLDANARGCICMDQTNREGVVKIRDRKSIKCYFKYEPAKPK